VCTTDQRIDSHEPEKGKCWNLQSFNETPNISNGVLLHLNDEQGKLSNCPPTRNHIIESSNEMWPDATIGVIHNGALRFDATLLSAACSLEQSSFQI
jgi:hypothetical protein